MKKPQISLPPFQSKVAECLIRLGDAEGSELTNSNLVVLPSEKEKFEVLGEDMYLKYIRPVCVERMYLCDKIPTIKDLSSKGMKSYCENFGKETKKQRILRPSIKIYEDHQAEGSEQNPIEKKNTKGTKKGGKSDQDQSKIRKQQIKIKAFNEKFFNDLDFILSSHSSSNLQADFGFSSMIIEMKLMTFFYIRWFIDENYPQQRMESEQVFECINLLAKVLPQFEKYIGARYQPSYENAQEKEDVKENQNIPISPSLILDLTITLRYLIAKYHYTNLQVVFNYPRLAYDNRYHKFFPKLDIQPYPSQIELIRYIKSSIINPQSGTTAENSSPLKSKVIIYNTMVGAGKTSFVLALSRLISCYNEKAQDSDKVKILYACQLESVRTQLARMAQSKELKFSCSQHEEIRRGNKKLEYVKLRNPFFPGENEFGDLVISDWKNAFMMLDKHIYTEEELSIIEIEHNPQKNKSIHIAKLEPERTIIFIDEPTVSCEIENSTSTGELFEILAHRSPKLTVFASATMPNKEELSKTFELIEIRNPELGIEEVKSKEFQVGCQLYTFEGHIYYPHTGVTNKKELQIVISGLKENPFLMRIYTGTTLYFLIDKLQNLGIQVGQQLNLRGSEPLTHKDFPTMALQVLELIASQSDEIIFDICQLSQNKDSEYNPILHEDASSDDDFFNEIEAKVKGKKESNSYVDINKLLKEDAHKFLGGCLIGTLNPLEFAETYFESWVQGLPKIEKIQELYEESKDDILEEMQFIRGKMETDPEKQFQAKNKENPILPSSKRINTLHHYNKYSSSHNTPTNASLEKLKKSKIINPVNIDILDDFLLGEVDETILKLLLCGIGIYCEQGLPLKYLQKVEELGSANQLAYIITDKSLCYGVSFPISNIIILDDLAEGLSMSEMFQLIGRAGRVGRSWTARAFLEKKGLAKVFGYIHSGDRKMGNEAEVFEGLADYWIENPQLKLRTKNTEIRRYRGPPQVLEIRSDKEFSNTEAIEIVIGSEVITNISIIIKNRETEKVFSVKRCLSIPQKESGQEEHSNLETFEFPNIRILASDLPNISNSSNCAVLNVNMYCKNEEEFIKQTIKNACHRFFQEYHGFDTIRYLNDFSFKEFNDWYSKGKRSYCIMLECDEKESGKLYKNEERAFEFNEIKEQKICYATKRLEQVTEILQIIAENCNKLWLKLHSKPFNEVIWDEAKTLRSTLHTLSKRFPTLYEFINNEIESNNDVISSEFNYLTRKIENKDSLIFPHEMRLTILVAYIQNIQFFEHPNFYLTDRVRDSLNVVKSLNSEAKIQLIQMQENVAIEQREEEERLKEIEREQERLAQELLKKLEMKEEMANKNKKEKERKGSPNQGEPNISSSSSLEESEAPKKAKKKYVQKE